MTGRPFWAGCPVLGSPHLVSVHPIAVVRAIFSTIRDDRMKGYLHLVQGTENRAAKPTQYC